VERQMQYVNSSIDLLRHITLHRKRVYWLGQKINYLVDKPSLLKTILIAHDIEKYLVFPILWMFYAGKGNRKTARKFYTQMNKLGALLLKVIIFLRHGFVSQKDLDQCSRIEHIADVTDRNNDPVAMEEFCLTVQRPLSDFLELTDVWIAEDLAFDYKLVPENLRYEKKS
jgi:hypothetical protein